VGEQRRYERQLERRDLARIDREIMAAGRPDGLREREVELDVLPVTTPPQPWPVTAYVVYGPHHLRVDGWATRWTEHAVDVTWPITEDLDGPRHRAWLWRGAVRPRRS